MSYHDFIARKLASSPPTGIPAASVADVPMFDHQKALVSWALKRGRCAIFADTGLGKTEVQLEFCQRAIEARENGLGQIVPIANHRS
jgi:hypothetical protein